jgi:hypothetical protein
MNQEEKIKMMIVNYLKKKEQAKQLSDLEFHRKHLLLFLTRFQQLLARFSAPSSSLLSHDIFLVVKAATIVAKSDWERNRQEDSLLHNMFSAYFEAFDSLAAGIDPLEKSASKCAEFLMLAKPG